MNKLLDRYAVVFVAIAATLWASDAYFGTSWSST